MSFKSNSIGNDSYSNMQARFGWSSTFPHFSETAPTVVQKRLEDFIRDASNSQKNAWKQSIPKLQDEVNEVLLIDPEGEEYNAILEYELPLESRRPDVVLLAKQAVIVLELKGKYLPSQADLDQADAYARDLRCYHRECAERPVISVCVPMLADGYVGQEGAVHIAGPDYVDQIIAKQPISEKLPDLKVNDFLSYDAYCPLPTLVQAARELFHKGDIREIHRARSATDPAVQKITDIIHEAAKTKTRRLILLTGIPGAGKTLVGLRIVHAHFLDDLAIPRANGKNEVPAIFLSGNGPLVEVLQYELKGAGGGGKAFVRGVKDYVKKYSSSSELVPPEHVLVFDEAQRAFDAKQVQEKHSGTPGFKGGKSEPEHFIEFAERIPQWCVVIGLIGGGQEIHVGEEAGLGQWRKAVEHATKRDNWIVHGPDTLRPVFEGSDVPFLLSETLNLDTEIRFHLAKDIHGFVDSLLSGDSVLRNRKIAQKLSGQSYHLRITRDLDMAKSYLRERYQENKEARFGLIASSKDKDLIRYGIYNDFQSTKRVRFGPWYTDDEDAEGSRSCRRLEDVVTEFGAQGLELDASLLAWGTDLIRKNGNWSNQRARGYLNKAHVKNPFQLRINAYRVLLTRGRDTTVVYVPPMEILDETYQYLKNSGFKVIE